MIDRKAGIPVCRARVATPRRCSLWCLDNDKPGLRLFCCADRIAREVMNRE